VPIAKCLAIAFHDLVAVRQQPIDGLDLVRLLTSGIIAHDAHELGLTAS
jgi:hypothetical protein